MPGRGSLTHSSASLAHFLPGLFPVDQEGVKVLSSGPPTAAPTAGTSLLVLLCKLFNPADLFLTMLHF